LGAPGTGTGCSDLCKLSTGTWNELENIGNVGAWDELGVAAYIDGIGA